MSTRSSIFIKVNQNKATNPVSKIRYYRFYKHSDGYPTGNLNLIHKLIVLHQNVSKSVKSLMQLACQIDGSRAEYEGVKESLNDIVAHNEHGDLEWTYL